MVGFAVAALVAVAAAACGADTTGATGPGHASQAHVPVTATSPAQPADQPAGMPGSRPGTSAPPTPAGLGRPGATGGEGLAAGVGGVTLVPAATRFAANWPVELRFQVRGAGGRAITRFVQEQGATMHLYLIRSDLVGFQHVHPTMATDGTWTANLAAPASGFYRAYASFTTPVDGRVMPFVLSTPITIPGAAVPTPVPAPTTTTTVDGYTLRLSMPRGPLRAGMAGPLAVTVSRDGRPVTDLQPYLASYAHLSAFHQGDLAFAHLHPTGSVVAGSVATGRGATGHGATGHGATGHGATGHGGPTLTFDAHLPRAGAWRLYLQFRAGGHPHTAAVTLAVP
ncbi:hypothetical protein [Frankia sp. R82]|uniref:hypothetical protein n=1 Tax=Frankia sp. R82 TaxID=2950553 RepID=UPI002044CE20|nr:hypothetical protein [Frankia sp. R82]MCM3883245.1 hypothetical protein [Frankia sp. R82]